jgi:hypothetical protein
MKQIALFGLILALIGAVVVTADAGKPTPFKIEVTVSGSAAEMRCLEGCLWGTTSASCGVDATTCQFVIDHEGVGG